MTLLTTVSALTGKLSRKEKKKQRKLKAKTQGKVVLGDVIGTSEAQSITYSRYPSAQPLYTSYSLSETVFYPIRLDNVSVGVIGVSRTRGKNTLNWLSLKGRDQGNAREIVHLAITPVYREQVSEVMEGLLLDLAHKESAVAVVWLPKANTLLPNALAHTMSYYGESERRSDFYKVSDAEGNFSVNLHGPTKGVAGVWLPRVPLLRFAVIAGLGQAPTLEGEKLSIENPLQLSEKTLVVLADLRKVTTNPDVVDKRTGKRYTNPITQNKLVELVD